MRKLIRDKYDEIIESDRLSIIDDPIEKFFLYSDKIREELLELRETAYNDVDEFGDVIEALYAMAEFQGISQDDIEIARLKKIEQRGAFKKCLVLTKHQ